jgi:ion channel-forming bestrophin family protein
MIVRFSKNPFIQVFGVTFWNFKSFLYFAIAASAAFILCHGYDYHFLEINAVPVSILGGALAIFLGFKNSSAYDRWWEARKIWGAVVNDSRSIAMELLTYGMPEKGQEKEHEEWQKRTVYRHIGWVHALRSHLRGEELCEDLGQWVNPTELKDLMKNHNVPAQLIIAQGKDIALALKKGWIDEFRHQSLMTTNKKMYDNQGKAERIKNTVFPFYYNYFTSFFLWLFATSFPFALASLMHTWVMIPVSIAVSFAFYILNKSGQITETPFVGGAADTPLTTIARGIEIDLLEMLKEDEIPEPTEEVYGKFGVVYKP